MTEKYIKDLFGEIPDSWVIQSIGNVFTDFGDGNYSSLYPKRSQFINNGVPFIRAVNIVNGGIKDNGFYYISPQLHSILRKGHLKNKDVLIATRGEIGKIALVNEQYVGANINAQLVRIGQKESRMLPEFFYQLLLSDSLKKQFIEHQTGSALKQLPIANLKKIKIVLPPLSEQKRISDILFGLDEKIEILISKENTINELKYGLMQTLLIKGIGHTEFKSSQFGDIPVNWEIVKLSALGIFSKGNGITKNDLKTVGTPCIRYGEIYTKHHFVIKNFHSFIDSAVAENSTALKNGDILFTGSGETIEDIGKAVAFISNEKVYAGGDIIILSPFLANSVFLAYCLNSKLVTTQRRKFGQGNSVVHISAKNIGKIAIPLPPIKEQENIATIFTKIDEKLDVIKDKIGAYQQFKAGLMQQLFTGKIRVNTYQQQSAVA